MLEGSRQAVRTWCRNSWNACCTHAWKAIPLLFFLTAEVIIFGLTLIYLLYESLERAISSIRKTISDRWSTNLPRPAQTADVSQPQAQSSQLAIVQSPAQATLSHRQTNTATPILLAERQNAAERIIVANTAHPMQATPLAAEEENESLAVRPPRQAVAQPSLVEVGCMLVAHLCETYRTQQHNDVRRNTTARATPPGGEVLPRRREANQNFPVQLPRETGTPLSTAEALCAIIGGICEGMQQYELQANKITQAAHRTQATNRTQKTHPAQATHPTQTTNRTQEICSVEAASPVRAPRPTQVAHSPQAIHPVKANRTQETHPAQTTHRTQMTSSIQAACPVQAPRPAQVAHPTQLSHSTQAIHPVKALPFRQATPPTRATCATQMMATASEKVPLRAERGENQSSSVHPSRELLILQGREARERRRQLPRRLRHAQMRGAWERRLQLPRRFRNSHTREARRTSREQEQGVLSQPSPQPYQSQHNQPPENFPIGDLRSFDATGDSKELPCPICMERLGQEPISCGQCLHFIHAACLRQWLEQDATTACPVCRVPLTDE